MHSFVWKQFRNNRIEIIIGIHSGGFINIHTKYEKSNLRKLTLNPITVNSMILKQHLSFS